MSSILDALRKLEAEKAESNQSPAGVLDEVAAADELLGRGAVRKKVTIRLGTGTLVLGGLFLVVGLLAATVVFPAITARGTSEPATTIVRGVSRSEAVPVRKVSTPAARREALPAAASAASVSPAAPAPIDAPITVAATQPAPTPPSPQTSHEIVPPAVAPAPSVALPSVAAPTPSVAITTPQPTPPPPSVPPAIAAQPVAPQSAAPPPPPELPVTKTAPSEPSVAPPAEPKAVKPEPEHVVAAPPTPEPAPAAPDPEKVAKPKEEEAPAPREPETGKDDTVLLAKAEPSLEPKEDSPAPIAKKEPPRSQDTATTKERKTQPVSVFSLPVLRESDKERYGLADVRINMLLPATKTRPLASAIINLQTVYVGETIPGSQAVLIGVEARGIAIEIEGSGSQYHIRF